VHERGPVSGAVVALLATAGNRPVTAVTVALGPSMDPDAARTAWSAAAAGTAAATAAVTWSEAPDTLHCLSCGRDYPGDRLTPCPGCGGDGLVVVEAPAVEITAWRLGEAG
jgi:Zn finger protein HypA/HybF involved in hydrogenase expression